MDRRGREMGTETGTSLWNVLIGESRDSLESGLGGRDPRKC